jgi:antitoxin (DNA-binding transcriptional repressor) of toxin-antitoxin stability system
MSSSISIKQLHGATGEIVRRAKNSRTTLVITDRGKAVAVLARPEALAPSRPRRRKLLPGFQVLWAQGTKGSLAEDLDDVRGER